MPLPRRALLAAAPLLALTACFGRPGASPAAQDAQLIVKAITPVTQSIGGLGAPSATVTLANRALAAATDAASILNGEFTPGLLETQNFFVASQTLFQALRSVSNLPPASVRIVDAAGALLPTFAAVTGSPIAPPSMPPSEARLVLGGAEDTAKAAAPSAAPSPSAPAAVPPARPTPAAAASLPATVRFHVSANDFAGAVAYEFWDSGQVIEKGSVANLHILEIRFEAFKRTRLQQAP